MDLQNWYIFETYSVFKVFKTDCVMCKKRKEKENNLYDTQNAWVDFMIKQTFKSLQWY